MKLTFKVIFGITMPLLVWGQSLFEILGGQKVGTTSAVFLKINMGARSEGLGEAYVSIAEGPEGLWVNPSGVVFDRKLSFGGNHTAWPTGILIDHVGVTAPLGRYSALGIQVAALQTPYMERTDEYHPFGTGEYFTYGAYLLGVNYAWLVSDRFAAGFGAKLIGEVLDDLHSFGVLFDFGTLYLVGYKDIKIGVSLVNLGPDIKPSCDGCESFSVPIIYRVGVSGNPIKPLKLAFQIEKPSDNVEIFRIGTELSVTKFLRLRAGYKLNSRGPSDSNLNGLSTGFGLNYKGIELNYSFSNYGYFGDAHRIGLSFRK